MPRLSPKKPLGLAQRGVMRCLLLADGRPVTTSEIVARAYARRLYQGQNSDRDRDNSRPAVRHAAARLPGVERVGRSSRGRGRAILWRLRNTESDPPGQE